MNKISNILVLLSLLASTASSSTETVRYIRIKEVTQTELSLSAFLETNLPINSELYARLAWVDQELETTDQSLYYEIIVQAPEQEIKISLEDLRIGVNHPEILPSGDYLLTVEFNPEMTFSEDDPPQIIFKNELEQRYGPFHISNFGQSTAQQMSNRLKKQKWIMENVMIESKWNLQTYEGVLGPSTKYPTSYTNPDRAADFYFEEAKATIEVNLILNEIVSYAFEKPKANVGVEKLPIVDK